MNPGERVPLGRTSLVEVSRLGLGTAWLGNMYQAVDDAEVEALIERAFALGIRLFDTAPLYGLGLAESRLGASLADRPRDSFVVSTKVGRVLRPRTPDDPALVDEGRPLFVGAPALHPEFDFSYDATMRTVEGSLARLALDRVDVLLIHDPDDHYREALEGAYPALERLRSEGRVQAIGVGMNQPELLTRFARETDLDLLLLAGRYTLLDQTGLKELLPECAARGVSVVIGGVYNSGVLADPSASALYDYRYVQPDVLAQARRLEATCSRHDVSLRAAAIQFPLGHTAVAAVLTGVRSVAELEQNVAAFRTPIPGDLWTELASEGLIPADSPTPTTS